MRQQIHFPGMHRHSGPHEHTPRGSLFSRLAKAEGRMDYLAVAMIVVLGIAMVVGLLTASGVSY